ncbi:hypothetical protein LCGC14_2683370, partial [marine sediment metagenome]
FVRCADSVRKQTAEVRHLHMIDSDGKGPAYIRNKLLEQVRTKFVVFLDADDYLEPTFVYECIKSSTPENYVFTDWYEGPHSGEYSLYLAIDPHPRIEHAVTFMVVDKNNTMYVVDEIFEYCTADVLVDMIKEKCHGKMPEDILIDPIASTPDPSTKSRFAWDLVEYGLEPVPYPGSKNKDRGILMTRRALTPMLNGRPDPEGKPTLYFTHNCAHIRYEIARYAWDDWRKNDQNTKGSKQEPIKKDDHHLENLRRLVLHRPEWQSLDELEDMEELEPRSPGLGAYTGVA